MSHILKNENLEIHVDLPEEYYQGGRFDWTGKIAQVKFRNLDITGTEKPGGEGRTQYGFGLYNEFGIKSPPGFDDTDIGGWFHKIGVGLLQKTADQYLFSDDYTIRPCRFSWQAEPHKLTTTCFSAENRGYAYTLIKEIELLENGFITTSVLHNTGKKIIVTDEYNHNFMAINRDLVGCDYILHFPFELNSGAFEETVNLEQKVHLDDRAVTFNGTPTVPFFFSNLSGGTKVVAGWELHHTTYHIGIRETGSFDTRKINLWGCGHVISPELFVEVSIKPDQSFTWSRMYEVFDF